jgi:hypothetical protein
VKHSSAINVSDESFLHFLAGHPVISNAEHVRHLPPSWGTLYQLTKVEPAVLKAAIKDGRVNPKMERKGGGRLVVA